MLPRRRTAPAVCSRTKESRHENDRLGNAVDSVGRSHVRTALRVHTGHGHALKSVVTGLDVMHARASGIVAKPQHTQEVC